MNFKFKFLLIFAIQTHFNDAARIFGIFSFSERTQYAFAEPLLRQLAHRGHHLTVITNFPQQRPVENFRDIVIENNRNLFTEFRNYTMDNIDTNHYDILHAIYNRAFEMCLNIFHSPHVGKLREQETFDLIILDLFLSESLFGFAEYFNAPIVGVAALGTIPIIDDLVGNTSPLSYVPNFSIQRPYTSNMNFWLRCLNVAIHVLEWIHYNYKYMPVQRRIYEQHFPNASMSFEETQRNISLVLLNDHFTLGTSRPHVPNMIEVAGLHIPAGPHPISSQHLQHLLQQAKPHGVIYIETHSMFSQHLMDIFLKQFATIAHTIIWQMSRDFLPAQNMNVPTNVYFTSNTSRHSILAHSNIKLLICHGSYLDVIESVHYGIPILSIPNVYGSQEDYVDFIKKIGNGLSLTPKQLNAKSVAKALNDLLAADSYQRQHTVRLSQRFRDQPNAPMETAIFWIEYVLRHKGAKHMRNLGQNLNTWQYYNLDVMGFFTLVVVCIIYAFCVIINLTIRIVKGQQIKSIKRN